jgi:hypothetical protein
MWPFCLICVVGNINFSVTSAICTKIVNNDTKGLKGANVKAKANLTPAIGEFIQIASDKTEYPDYNNKHWAKAKYGWYRYNTRFGIPVYDEDGKFYLYDLVRTKKETSKPLEH